MKVKKKIRSGSRIPNSRGSQPSERCQHTILSLFGKKLHEIKKIWAMGVCPSDPPPKIGRRGARASVRLNMVNSELANGDKVGHDFLMGLNRGSHSNFFRSDRNVTYKLTIFFSNKYKQNTFSKNLKTISSISFTRVSDYALFSSVADSGFIRQAAYSKGAAQQYVLILQKRETLL